MRLKRFLESDSHVEFVKSWLIENCWGWNDDVFDRAVTINHDGSVDFIGIGISLKKFVKTIPFKIRKIKRRSFEVTFSAELSQLVSLKNCPDEIDGDFRISDCKNLDRLDFLPYKILGGVHARRNKQMPLLRVLLIKGCTEFKIGSPGYDGSQEIEKIMKPFIGGGRAAIIPCQDALIEAGFTAEAKL